MSAIAVVLIIGRLATHAFEFRESNPAALFPYYCAVDDTGSGNLANPSFLPLNRYAYICSSYNRPYADLEVQAANARIGQGLERFGWQVAWGGFGIDAYREDTVEANVGWRPVRMLSVGAGASYYSLSINTEDLGHAIGMYDGRASVLFMPVAWADIGVRQENIGSLFMREREDLLFPETSAGVALKPARGVALIYNFNRTYYGALNSVAVSANLLDCLNVKVGYSRETTTYAASISIAVSVVRASYGIRQHPYLGLSHSFAVTVATNDIPFEQIPYTEPVMTRREAIPASQKLDINNCVIEELRELPLMTDALAARIMQHRRMIGPVNARILEQLGMSRRDIAAFRSYARWDDPKKKREWSPRSPKRAPSRANAHERAKALFRQLLESGLTAADALDLSELAGSAQPAEIERRAAAIRGITESTRRLVVKLCTGR